MPELVELEELREFWEYVRRVIRNLRNNLDSDTYLVIGGFSTCVGLFGVILFLWPVGALVIVSLIVVGTMAFLWRAFRREARSEPRPEPVVVQITTRDERGVPVPHPASTSSSAQYRQQGQREALAQPTVLDELLVRRRPKDVDEISLPARRGQAQGQGSSQRSPLTPQEWSTVTSPGFSSRVVRTAEGVPSDEYSFGHLNSTSPFQNSPNRGLGLGQIPYGSKYRRPLGSPPQPNSPKLSQFRSYGIRDRSQGRDVDNNTAVYLKIAPIDNGKSFLNLAGPPTPEGGESSLSKAGFGLGGTIPGSLTNKMSRLWPSANNSVYETSSASITPAILEALNNRKRSRGNSEANYDKTPPKCPPGVSPRNITPDEIPKSSKRLKFIENDEENHALSSVPLTNYHTPQDESMTSESILEQMNQTEKRFLPDDDSPPAIRPASKRQRANSTIHPRSTSTPISSHNSSGGYKKRRASPGGTINIQEEDEAKEKIPRFCTCTECYDESAGKKPGSPTTHPQEAPTPQEAIQSKKRVTFSNDAKTTSRDAITTTPLRRIEEQSVSVLASQPVVTHLRSPLAPLEDIIDKKKYEADRALKADRLSRMLDISIQKSQQAQQILMTPIVVTKSATASTTPFVSVHQSQPATAANTSTAATTSGFSFGLGASSSPGTSGLQTQAKSVGSEPEKSSVQTPLSVLGNSSPTPATTSQPFSFGAAASVSATPTSTSEPQLAPPATGGFTGFGDQSKKLESNSGTSTATTSTTGGFSFGKLSSTTAADQVSATEPATSGFKFGDTANTKSTASSSTSNPPDFGDVSNSNAPPASVGSKPLNFGDTFKPSTFGDSVKPPIFGTTKTDGNSLPSFSGFGQQTSSASVPTTAVSSSITTPSTGFSGFGVETKPVLTSLGSTSSNGSLASTAPTGIFSFGPTTSSSIAPVQTPTVAIPVSFTSKLPTYGEASKPLVFGDSTNSKPLTFETTNRNGNSAAPFLGFGQQNLAASSSTSQSQSPAPASVFTGFGDQSKSLGGLGATNSNGVTSNPPASSTSGLGGFSFRPTPSLPTTSTTSAAAAQTPSTFSFGDSSKSPFGSTTSSGATPSSFTGFGPQTTVASTATVPNFLQPQSSGTSTLFSGFGGQTIPQTTSLGLSNTTGNTSNSNTVSSWTPTPFAYGQTKPTLALGSAQNTSVVQAPTTSSFVFGNTSKPSSVFGTNTNGAGTMSSFPGFGQQSTSVSSSLSTPAPTFSGFGDPSKSLGTLGATTSNGSIASSVSSSTPGPFVFGQTASSSSPFGQTQPAGPTTNSFVFGDPSKTPVFGAANTGVNTMQPQPFPVFGQQANSASGQSQFGTGFPPTSQPLFPPQQGAGAPPANVFSVVPSAAPQRRTQIRARRYGR